MIRLFEIFVCHESTRIFTHWSFLCPSNRQMCNQPFFSLLYAYIVPCYPRMTKLISMLKFLNIVCALSRITITENNVCFISFCEKALEKCDHKKLNVNWEEHMHTYIYSQMECKPKRIRFFFLCWKISIYFSANDVFFSGQTTFPNPFLKCGKFNSEKEYHKTELTSSSKFSNGNNSDTMGNAPKFQLERIYVQIFFPLKHKPLETNIKLFIRFRV